MRQSDVFKIVLGNRWQEEPEPNPWHELRRRVDFSSVQGPVDIVIGGRKLCHGIEDDSIFFLARDLLAAVEKLSQGEGVCRVSFYESPWELVLQRVGARIFVTFYQGGHHPDVAVKDLEASFGQLAQGVIASAVDLEIRAIEMDPKAEENPLVAEISEARKRVEKLTEDVLSESDGSALETTEVESTRWSRARTEDGFSLGFKFRAGVTDLLAPCKPRGSDLNPLLFKGRLVVHARGKRLELGEGFLFLQVERMISSVKQLLAAWEERRPASIRLAKDGLSIGVRVGRDNGLVISLMDLTREESICVLNDLKPSEYADAVLGVSRELRRLILQTNPIQRNNLRLDALNRDIGCLSEWLREQKRGTLINRDAEHYRRGAERSGPDDTSPAINVASRLKFQEQWRLEAEGLDLGGTMLLGRMALIATRTALIAVDSASGSVIWRRETEPSNARIQVVGRDTLVRALSSGRIDAVDLGTGTLRWRTEIAPRSGGSPTLLGVDHGSTPGIVVAAEDENRLVAIDIRNGELKWKYSASRAERFALRRHGKLIYVSSGGNVSAIDIEDGALVWRYAERTRFSTPVAVSQDVVIAASGMQGKPGGGAYAIDAFSGEPIWSAPLGGWAIASPLVADRTALVPVNTDDHTDVVALDLESGDEMWRRSFAGWSDSCAILPVDSNFIINSAGGMVRSIKARSGRENWVTTLGPACSDDVPLALKIAMRGGVLFVPSDTVYIVGPDDGRLIHSLGTESPVPDLLMVDPSCSIFVAEESGHIAMFALQSSLSLVPV